MTLIWFVVWLVFNLVGDNEPRHVRSRQLVDGTAAPGHRPRPEPTARPPARQDVGRRLTEPSPIYEMTRAPHALAAEDVARGFDADLERGLSDAEAAARLVRFGPNRLPRAHRPAYPAIALRQFADPLVGLLLGAVIVSLLIGERIEAAAIAAIVLLNALLGFVQEARAESAVLALREVLEEFASVVRGGREREVGVEQLVPGDLVVLREGERVPADVRLVVAAGLAVDESTLTGESVPVDKAVDAVLLETPLAERTSIAYAGSSVTRGRGRGIVTATGSATELGAIAGTDGAGEAAAHTLAAPHRCAHPRDGRLSGSS